MVAMEDRVSPCTTTYWLQLGPAGSLTSTPAWAARRAGRRNGVRKRKRQAGERQFAGTRAQQRSASNAAFTNARSPAPQEEGKGGRSTFWPGCSTVVAPEMPELRASSSVALVEKAVAMDDSESPDCAT